MRSRNHFASLSSFLWLAPLLLPGSAQAQVRKACGGGITLKLNAGIATQGSLLLGEVAGTKALPAITAEWNGRTIPLWSEGKNPLSLHALLGVDLQKAPGRYEWKISWEGADGQANACSAAVLVHAGKFPTERLKVEKQFVQPDPEQEKRAEEDQKKMRAIYDTVTPEPLWKGRFQLPLKGVTTGGNFGRRRILNGEARAPHAGVDLPAAGGTPVFAAQAGKVVLAEELFYSGNTVVIDHGYGIYTLYAHLSEIAVRAGDPVDVSTEIGKVGATGRVTGPHLHWGLTVDHARVNGLDIVHRQP
jgi:murein DD-endopeptidase MepM/ murein hydrolase activator NlpD